MCRFSCMCCCNCHKLLTCSNNLLKRKAQWVPSRQHTSLLRRTYFCNFFSPLFFVIYDKQIGIHAVNSQVPASLAVYELIKMQTSGRQLHHSAHSTLHGNCCWFPLCVYWHKSLQTLLPKSVYPTWVPCTFATHLYLTNSRHSLSKLWNNIELGVNKITQSL